MTAEGTREPASEAGSGILGGVSSSPADSLRTQPQPRAVSDRRLVEDARHRLLDVISLGTLRPDDRLGTERELASRLSVSRSTLRQVLAMLAESGIVCSVPGRAGGTLVTFRTRAERAQIVELGTRDSVVDALSAAAFGPS
jgi:DNA-binding FadR family transcriptional regulator